MALPTSTLNECDNQRVASPNASLLVAVGKSEGSPKIFDDSDISLMSLMHYTQELKQGFSGLMSFTFCFTVVSVFPSISIGLDFGLSAGGPGKTILLYKKMKFINFNFRNNDLELDHRLGFQYLRYIEVLLQNSNSHRLSTFRWTFTC